MIKNFKYMIIIAGLLFLSFASQNKVRLFLAGDSTIAEKLPEKRPETGWGEKLAMYLNDNVIVENHAKNGRSTRTFIEEGRWQAIMDSIKPGDFVMIQFGHNDQSKKKVDRYTPPQDFKDNLKKFVTETREKKATPILITPVMRRRFDKEGKFFDVHGEYPDLVRDVAKELHVLLIDLHRNSESLIKMYGEQESKKIFLWLAPGENNNYPDGLEDNTHFSEYGAELIAGLVADGIKSLDCRLKDYLKKN